MDATPKLVCPCHSYPTDWVITSQVCRDMLYFARFYSKTAFYPTTASSFFLKRLQNLIDIIGDSVAFPSKNSYSWILLSRV